MAKTPKISNPYALASLLQKENIELRRLLEEVRANVNAFTVRPEAIATFRGDKIKRGSWIYFRRALYNRIVAALGGAYEL